MRIEQYQELDMRTAMRRVAEDLGHDAVIISTRRVGDMVEVVAAVDYDEALFGSLQAEQPRRASGRDNVVELEPPPVHQPPVLLDSQMNDLKQELSRLRSLFEGELSELTWQQKGARQPGRAMLQKQMENLGLSRPLCSQIIDSGLCSDDLEESWAQVQQILVQSIGNADHNILKHGGRIAVVGSTGVGKTTTVAKLAARFALRHGRNQVGLITTDRLGVGTQQQLFTFGSALGVPVQAASAPADLARSLASMADRKLVLIDTAGISQRDMGLTNQFVALAAAGVDIQTYLVLSAITQQQVINEIVKAFSHIGLAGTIVTKTDEAASLGPIISTLIRHKLDLAYIGNGQRVPEDLLPGKGSLLVEEAMNLMAGSQEGYRTPMEHSADTVGSPQEQ